MGLLDPVKEVQGAALRRKYGFSTGEREAAELTGTDYDNNIDQIAIENSTWQSKGLEVPQADNTGGDSGLKTKLTETARFYCMVRLQAKAAGGAMK